MKVIDNEEELGEILKIRNRIAASQSFLSRKWILDTGVFVMAAENAVHFVDGEDDVLAAAFQAETSGRLIGVRNDHDIKEDHAVIVEPTPEDFDLLGREFIGQFFLLFSEDERHAVLFTAAGEYKLIAGPLSFLHRIFPDLPTQKREFIEFKNEELSYPHTAWVELVLENATRFMDWLD
jgi:hypothetical protein